MSPAPTSDRLRKFCVDDAEVRHPEHDKQRGVISVKSRCCLPCKLSWPIAAEESRSVYDLVVLVLFDRQPLIVDGMCLAHDVGSGVLVVYVIEK